MDATSTPTTDGASTTADTEATKQVWMVERTFSADSPNILVVVYATADGAEYLRKEWAFNRFGATAGAPSVTAARTVTADRLSSVEDSETRARYATEAARMRERHDPDDAV